MHERIRLGASLLAQWTQLLYLYHSVPLLFHYKQNSIRETVCVQFVSMDTPIYGRFRDRLQHTDK